MWLECPVEETDDRGRKTRTTEARDNRRGIPQGSPISPLLARGWISPRGTPSAESARLLLEANYAWQGDVFDDDRPYLQIFEGQASGADRIVAIPLTMEINDLPHAMRFGRSPGQYVELFDAAVARMRKDEGEAVMLDVTAHAHVYGRPAGAWAFEAVAAKAGSYDDVWLATRGEIAAYVRQTLR